MADMLHTFEPLSPTNVVGSLLGPPYVSLEPPTPIEEQPGSLAPPEAEFDQRSSTFDAKSDPTKDNLWGGGDTQLQTEAEQARVITDGLSGIGLLPPRESHDYYHGA